jgi:uncharacterized membrane protein YfhO
MNRFKKFLLNGAILTLTSVVMRMIGVSFNVYISNKIGAEAMVCFDVPAGEHTIEMRFCPPGLKEGAVISAAAIVLFALLIVYRRKCGKAV